MKKPEPVRWTINEHGIVEHYDFTQHTRRNPPAKDDEPVILEHPFLRHCRGL